MSHRRGKLLALLCAWLGLSLGATGCQTATVFKQSDMSSASSSKPLWRKARAGRTSTIRVMPSESFVSSAQSTEPPKAEATAQVVRKSPYNQVMAGYQATPVTVQGLGDGDEPQTLVRVSASTEESSPPQVFPAEAAENAAPAEEVRPAQYAAAATGHLHHGHGMYYGGDPSVAREGAKTVLPIYIIEPPDILTIELRMGLPDQPLPRQVLVRPDGTVGLGLYGSVRVAGLTLDEAQKVIEEHLAKSVKNPKVAVDVYAYNSKFFYVVTDGGGYGEQVIRLPITGNETVLDAIGQVNGLPAVASKKQIWVARPDGMTGQTQVLPVDWIGIVQRGASVTNYQIFPNDRVYVHSDKMVRFDSAVAKTISPFERIFGFTLLGNTTVQNLRVGKRAGVSGN